MIAANIRRLCKEQGITISALEKSLNIGNGTISRWDNSSPRVDTLKLVADNFGITVDSLLRPDDAQIGAAACSSSA